MVNSDIMRKFVTYYRSARFGRHHTTGGRLGDLFSERSVLKRSLKALSNVYIATEQLRMFVRCELSKRL
jgi:hypothetical protein